MEKIGVNLKIPYLCRMDIQPIAHFESPLKSKFGIPRQSGLVEELTGRIVFEKPFRQPEAVRGLESFDYLWLIWEFSGNHKVQSSKLKVQSLTVRPPRLGGNRRIGVFASRSPFRPNPLGLSCVKIDKVEEDRLLGPVIYVRGADLMDGTPIYDIKPYVTYADAHPEARSGFVDEKQWEPLHVKIPDKLAVKIPSRHFEALKATLAQDPRPAFHDDPERTYGMPFLNMDVRFRVKDDVLTVVDLVGAPKVGSRLVDDDAVETQQ
jgi:tRNA-Thr(GGU) m(6)t(6)A37 methyltransferase TsaA